MISAKGKSMKIVGLAIAVSSMVGLSTQAFATLTCGTACPPATASITVRPFTGGDTITIPVPVVPTGPLFTVTGFTQTIPGLATVSIDSLQMNPDPFIFFAIGAVNSADFPLVFTYSFSTPINMPGDAIDATSSLQISMLDGGATGAAPAVTVAPFIVGGKIMISNDFTASLAGTNKGVDVGDTSVGGTAPCGAFAGSISICPTVLAGPNTFAQNPADPFATMGTLVAFVLTPHDATSMVGRVDQIVYTPEPTTLLLLGSGLAGLGAWRRYRASR